MYIFLYYFYIKELKINSFFLLIVKSLILFIIIDKKNKINKIYFIHVIKLIIEKIL